MSDQPLPTFRYFRDPGVFRLATAAEPCACCGEARGLLYDGPFRCGGETPAICPWCIADGRAAARFDGAFNDPEDASPDSMEAVRHRTPGFYTFQDWSWPAHCGEACVYVGEVGGDAVRTDRDAALVEACLNAYGEYGYGFTRASERAERRARARAALPDVCDAGHLVFYEFRCLHCGEPVVLSDCD